MKKIFLFLCLICLLVTGCGKQSEKEVLKEFNSKVNNANSYYLSGEMELVNNEDVYNYDIQVSFKQDDNYKIELTNKINDHKQIILRNSEGVYIVTPSLNKSFKFQSDWPYNNSQVYLLSSLMDDINNDDARTFEIKDGEYVFTSTVNYPNNEKLVKQKVYFGKNYLPIKVEVIDSDGNTQIKMAFEKIDLKMEFNDTYFDLNSVLTVPEVTPEKEKQNTNNDNTTETQEPNSENANEEKKTKQAATIEDVIYPMYLPVNTYLAKQEKVSTEDGGERLILTFTGDSSFVLVEQTAEYSSTPEIIPTYGSPELIGSSLAVVNDNSANWFLDGIEYYIVSDVMATDELLQVVRSISVLPVSK